MLTGATGSALVLVDSGKREGGRWKRGALANQEYLNSDWRNKLTQAGTILDHAADLTEQAPTLTNSGVTVVTRETISDYLMLLGNGTRQNYVVVQQ